MIIEQLKTEKNKLSKIIEDQKLENEKLSMKYN